MTDRYVIVYQDGVVGEPYPIVASDDLLRLTSSSPDVRERPAYRIRIREKQPLDLLVEEAQSMGFYLNPPQPCGAP